MKASEAGVLAIRIIAGAAIVFAVCMIVASVALMTPSCAGKFSYGYVLRSPFVGAVLYGAVILGIWSIIECFSRRHPSWSVRAEMFFLAFLCLSVYSFFIVLLPAMGQVPGAMTFDPAQVLRSMESGRVCHFHDIRNQGWCNYEILMSILAVIFKGGQQFGEAFQALCCAMSLLPLFRLAERVAGRRVARFTVLMAGLSPTMVMYSVVLTSEIISSSLMVFAAYCFLDVFAEKHDKLDAALMMFVGGVLLALSDLFKVIAVVFVVAAVVLLVVGALRSGDRRFVFRLMAAALVFYPSYRLARHVGQMALSALAQVPQEAATGKQSSALLYELVLGLNLESEGFYSGKLAHDFIAMPVEKQKEFAKKTFCRDWGKYPMLMIRKFRNIHGSSNYHHGAVSTFRNIFKDKSGKWHAPGWICPLADSGTMFFKVVFLFGCVGLFLSASRSFVGLAPGVLSASIVLCFAVVEQLIEGHGRYKISIYPFYFLIVPYAFVALDSMRRLIGRGLALFRDRNAIFKEVDDPEVKA